VAINVETNAFAAGVAGAVDAVKRQGLSDAWTVSLARAEMCEERVHHRTKAGPALRALFQ
jgi:hypothetical protein